MDDRDPYDVDQNAADLGQAKATVHGTTIGTVKAGSRLCRVAEGIIVAHPDDRPYLLCWNGERIELEVAANGAIVMPTVAGLDTMTVSLTVNGFFESLGFDSAKWLTREQQLIEDLRAVVSPSAINEVSATHTAELVTLCRRALDVLEDLA